MGGVSPAALAAARRVLFVSGKGGVGKTSVASGLAVARARAGGRVLVVSTDPAHNLGHVWGAAVGDDPTRLLEVSGAAGEGWVDGIEIDPQATVDRHLATVRHSMHRLLPERLHAAADRHLDLARDAPGTHESAVLERIAETVEIGLADYDLVLFDTAPTGHTLRLMALPEQLTAWTETLLANRDRSERFGAAVQGLGGGTANADRDAELRRVLVRRRHRFATLKETVTDAERCAFVLVLAAERLPVLETLDLHARLDELGIAVGGLVVNRRSPADAGELLAARRVAEDAQLEVLREGVAGAPVHEIALQAEEPIGPSGLARMGDLLG